jgi:hypothetical protein
MTGPLGVVQAGPTTPTTIVEEVVDGGPPGGVLLAGPTPTTIEAEGDVDGGPLGGATSGSGHHRS